nr:probable serine hydrolase [Cherax quadricarinatus]XP_053650645.1 probable serine hydrolase [Cherax quadricarinatus]XP_053650654.1 probable serine hydrolase [Cherax quadricarinatus]XP_053650660.1 probable serine hydrolase [Cherax quadricarinatus]XP_053650670.1 probable serine hydrolase [Cherax quadricarinatus]XP_053650678.1 probable serine hydrolase [Cherax quadricarinatus]
MPQSPVHAQENKDQQVQYSQEHHPKMENKAWEWEEIEIDIGWGTLRGKAKGSGSQCMLGLHGWLDNANTFDLIAPFLPEDVRFISLDFPGHGHSDHFPPAFIYDPRGYVGSVKKAMTTIGWNRFILLGHSMGAVVGIIYTSVFPEDVEAFISIDIIKPTSYAPEKYATQYKKYFLQYLDNEKKAAQPALVYDEEELVRKTIEGSKSLDDRGARILLQRGARRIEEAEGLILTRDLRAKVYFIGFLSSEGWIEIAKAITCPLLFIKAKEGHTYSSAEEIKAMLSAFKQDCKHYCYYEMPGKHHLHLTHPKPVAECILNFIDECKSILQLVLMIV